MDSGAISQLVFLVFGIAVFIYGIVVYRGLAALRAANDRTRAKLDALVREQTENPRSAELGERIATATRSFNQEVVAYNARIGGFPESIVAAIAGIKRREALRASGEVGSKKN